MGLGSKGVEDTGKFDGDVASVDDDNPFHLVFEFEETRGDTEARSGNFIVSGNGRVATDGDANVIGLDCIVPHQAERPGPRWGTRW